MSEILKNINLKGDKVIWGVIISLSLFSVLLVYSTAGWKYLFSHLIKLSVGLFFLYQVHKIKFKYFDKQGGGSGLDKIEIGQPTGITSAGLAPVAPDKKPQWQIDRDTIKASSTHVGKVGDRMEEDLTLTKNYLGLMVYHQNILRFFVIHCMIYL